MTGRCYVLTFSAKHHLTLADMAAREILPVIQTWTRIYAGHLSASHPLRAEAAQCLQSIPPNEDGEVTPSKHQLRYMQIFENKGAAMGCSNPHPHCQIWTTSTLPEEPGKELVQMAKYHQDHGRHLLEDYAKLEMDKSERVVWQNDAFLAICPWWAVWPFEVLILAKRHVRALVDLSDEERLQFADAIQEVTRRYDNLFETSFPYSEYRPSAPNVNTKRCTIDARFQRFRHPSGAIGLHGRRGRDELVTHALLPTSSSLRDSPKVSGRVRAHGRAAARHHARASGCSAQGLRRGSVSHIAEVTAKDFVT